MSRRLRSLSFFRTWRCSDESHRSRSRRSASANRGQPGRQMMARDAGVRTTIRAAVGQCRRASIRRVLAVEAERRIGIEESIGQ
jgi:hypothetical protein